jgi:RNA polymerase sigma factor (sigma-70 family)
MADRRLQREYRERRTWLMGVVIAKHGVDSETAEEIVDDVLLAWHRQLSTSEGVRNDRAFCRTVARSRTIEWLRRKSIRTVELALAESVGFYPQLDLLVAEREELCDLRELAREVLDPVEFEILELVEEGARRAEVAQRFGLSVRQVIRLLGRARRKLDVALAEMREHGRCGMLAPRIADINAGRIGPGEPGWEAGTEHLARCRRCRSSAPPTTSLAA